jgi:hypothetical protein
MLSFLLEDVLWLLALELKNLLSKLADLSNVSGSFLR